MRYEIKSKASKGVPAACPHFGGPLLPTVVNGPSNKNHGLTTDGTNLYVMTVPWQNQKIGRCYKLNQSLAFYALINSL
jgi:hypothetical protein